jgi:(2Fe-2S) ferredoxin
MPDKDRFYNFHFFFCTNKREGGSACSDFGANAMREHAKQLCSGLGLLQDDNVRVNTSGCLGRCEFGPVIAVYPEGVWYTYIDADDVAEIIHEHVIGGRVVQRLKI